MRGYQTEIKRLAKNHLHQIVAFDMLCFPTDCWNENEWDELLSDELTIYYALLDKDQIIGNIFIYNWVGQRDYIKIMNLAVHPDHRKHGYAHRLLEYAAIEMEKIGMHCFRGETRASNKAMQSVFESCGYQLAEIEENYYDEPSESAYKYILTR